MKYLLLNFIRHKKKIWHQNPNFKHYAKKSREHFMILKEKGIILNFKFIFINTYIYKTKFKKHTD